MVGGQALSFDPFYGTVDVRSVQPLIAVGSKMADRIEALTAEVARSQADLTEARRRRDEWMAKAQGFEEIRLALREKVGSPWPPHMSRLLWAGIAADQKARADEAEAEVARLQAGLATGEDQPKPARYVWLVERDAHRWTCETLRDAEMTRNNLRLGNPNLPVTITRYAEAPE